jgi:hypothetical protein
MKKWCKILPKFVFIQCKKTSNYRGLNSEVEVEVEGWKNPRKSSSFEVEVEDLEQL